MSYFRSCIFLTTFLLNTGFLLIIFTGLHAQSSEDVAPIFSSDEPLEISLIFDVKKMLKGKFKAEYQPATLVYQKENIPNVYDTVPLKVKARGNSRRSICQFPPLRLNFAPKKTPEGFFSGLDKIKLVSYCKNSDMYEQYVLKEYYIYKLYELFSEKTFKTRLLRVTYQDSRGKRKPIIRYGFIIEAEELVAERLNSHPFETSTMHPDNCDRVATTKLSVFQYMIGNTDWSVAKQHNIKLFIPKNISAEVKPFAIPYDFDYSGFVNAHYAEVSDILPIDYITQRYYLGYCCEEETLEKVLEDFSDKKEQVLNLVKQATLLEEREREEVIGYLTLFYDKLAKPNLIASVLERQCK